MRPSAGFPAAPGNLAAVSWETEHRASAVEQADDRCPPRAIRTRVGARGAQDTQRVDVHQL
eukprot:5865425-Pyramimonas_sp.AAC.1